MSGSQVDPFAFTLDADAPPSASAAPAPQSTSAPSSGPDPFSYTLQDTLPTDKIPAGLKPYAPLIEKYAAVNGVPSLLAAALVEQESGGNPKAVSDKGAQGLTQIMPETGKSLGLKNAFDPDDNLDKGFGYLRSLYDQTIDPKTGVGDWGAALRGYNGGPSAMSTGGGLLGAAKDAGYGVLNTLAPGWDQLAGPGKYARDVLAKAEGFGQNLGDLQLPSGYPLLGVPQPGYAEAALTGATDGMAPKAEAALDAGVGSIFDALSMKPSDFATEYKDALSNETGGQDVFMAAHPVSGEAAELVGSAAPAIVGGGLADAGLGLLPKVGDAIENGTGTGANLLRALVRNPIQGAAAGLATAPLNSGQNGASPGEDMAAGAIGSTLLGPVGAGVGKLGNKLMQAIYHPGNLTPEEADLFDKAGQLGIPLGPHNLAGVAESTPEQNAALTKAALRTIGVDQIDNLKDFNAVQGVESSLNDKINQLADKLPIDMSGPTALQFNSAMQKLYDGNILDQDMTGDLPAVRRSPARERILQIQQALQQSGANSAQVKGNAIVSGRVVDTLLSPGGPVRGLIDSPNTQISTIGTQIKNFLEANQKDVAGRSGVDFAQTKAGLQDANANYRVFKTIQNAAANNSENGTVLPRDLINAVAQDSAKNNAMVRYNPKLKDLSNIAKNFLVANGKAPHGNFMADARNLGYLSGAGGAVGYALGHPELGAGIGAAIGGANALRDLTLPAFQNSPLYTNNLLAAARGQAMRAPVPTLPPQYANALQAALSGAAGQIPQDRGD